MRRLHVTPQTSVAELVADSSLDSLIGLELLIYFKLVMLLPARSRRLKVANRDLHPDARTTIRILHQLEQKGFVKLVYDDQTKRDRTIEVL